ncbi:MAG: rRNA pseudouridine synthase [Clostridia bacterium]|nr:rRNA pseudouridine synthase [Clostridia bacterium]
MRINKYLAECGVASRRQCDKLIEDGAVKINGRLCALGAEVNDGDTVTVNGKKISREEKWEYYILNKPKGYVCTVSDDLGRKTVMELLPKHATRVYPIGRLDYATEGLLLFTNDGDLAFRLTHPKNEIPKTYMAKIEGSITEAELDKLRFGVEIDGKMTARCKVSLTETGKEASKVVLTITEGRNRQVRKMFEAIGKNVILLKRTKIGDLTLHGLDRGQCRALTPKEVEYLKLL